ncbi:MAG: methionyl-tRNA formyltransferase [Clostridia bacterium]|nr:methionyl-tRNA formyltransferase [Clostridia bacterium]
MRIVFLGTPEFAVNSLNALVNEFEVVAVVTQPDREKDRKGRIIEGAVSKRANELGIPVHKFEKIRRDGVSVLRELAPDLMVTCAYGQMLSQEIIDIAPYGIFNVHGSLLPKYRGSAPIQRALVNGEPTTGITIMKTDIGMDSGDILAIKEIAIDHDDYVDELYAKLSVIGAELLIDTIKGVVEGKISPVKQNESEVTYAPMIKKEDGLIDFSLSATDIRNKIRGVGFGVCSYQSQPLKIYKLDISMQSTELSPGTVIDANKKGITVACGNGSAIVVTELQQSGKKRMRAVDFLNGVKIKSGDEFNGLA